jgi:hypothetical protein
MIQHSIERLEHLCSIIPPLVMQESEQEFRSKPAPGSWSRQEILGHLIDSAANNHQRFIRVQFEDVPQIRYDQDQWVLHNHYNELPMKHVVDLWRLYHLHLLEVMKRIPAENLSRHCNTGGADPDTLEFLVNDYVVHQEHHLRQFLTYD